MRSNPSFKFKAASEDWEFEAVYRLLYNTFVEEIPQYQSNPEQGLIDKFDSDNRYLICLDGRQLAGMITFRDKRPFSLDQKIPNLDDYLPKNRKIGEVRLLAVDKNYRHGAVLPGLIALLEKQARARRFDMAVMSAPVRQLKLYRHLGCVPFGPLVGTPGAEFQPMMLHYEAYMAQTGTILEAWRDNLKSEKSVNFLPGPVALHSSVRRAFAQPPVSHRSRSFRIDFQHIREQLCKMVGASRVEIMLGSGTLANDAIAGQVSLLEQPGLILTNGEFGERIADQAQRFGLSFDTLAKEWGAAFSPEEIRERLDRKPELGWLWTVHCETSTSVLNDIETLAEICGERSIKLCLDCVSTIGTVPVNLNRVYLASAVSGKGLGSLAGLAMVFYHHELAPAPRKLPRYLDLGYYAEHDGIPFTHSSNLLEALHTALGRAQNEKMLKKKREMSTWLRIELQQQGFQLIATDIPTSPAVITIALAGQLSSERIGWKLEEAGFQLSYRSEYLKQRNWIQICLMGECRITDLRRLLNTLIELCRPPLAPTRGAMEAKESVQAL